VKRGVMRPSLLAVPLALLFAGCQSGSPPLSVDEAKKVTADFGGTNFIPPPRTIADITAILDQQKPDEAYRTAILARLNEPPSDKTPAGLSSYYRVRGDAALTLGLTDQALSDLRASVRYAKEANRDVARALVQLGNAEYWVNGNADTTWREMLVAAQTGGSQYFAIEALKNLTESSAVAGDFVSARRLIEEADRALLSLRGGVNARAYAQAVSIDAEGHGNLEEAMGHFAEAERWQRKAIAEWRVALAYLPTPVSWTTDISVGANHRHIVTLSQYLTRILLAQERAAEAEAIARGALLYALQFGGRSSPNTAIAADNLGRVLFWQGRTADAERMSLSAIETSAAIRMKYLQRNAQNHLADAVAMQGRWTEALAQYEDAAEAITIDPQYIASKYITFPRILALYETDHLTEGRSLAGQLAEQRAHAYGDDAPDTALAKGFVAAGLALQGDRGGAIELFRVVLPQIILSSRAAAQRGDQGTLDREYRRYVLETYLRLLTGSQIETPSQINVAAAFQIADNSRSAVAAQALASSAARANLHNPELGDLARREQDTRQQINARLSIVANVLSKPVEQQNAEALAAVRAETESLKAAWAVLRELIEKRFPDYAHLVNPPPATIEQARAALTADEALVTLYAGEKESYAWALRNTGAIAFAVVPLRRDQLAGIVSRLRRALDPNAATLGDIPAFDVVLAHRLYAAVLQPVEAGWKGAKTLIVVPHGPLSEVPFGLLVTKSVPQQQDGAGLFSSYKDVPFLVREVAVTQVPSVAALTILRGMPPAGPTRRAFVGFGDPWFSASQAAQAKVDPMHAAQLDARGFHLRATPATESLASANVSMLPRLPDTAFEVREVAATLQANPATDVFLGPAANERQVRTMKLDDRRVVMFATHGLVPGDLDGLTQPALALTAPSVAGVDGDGLLTMDKILGLRLDADWVVLSACNTSAGNGAGAEAVSGLGRAFFYAGARALLVTNWPVETTSARALTTTVFKRQAADASLSRAEALRASMLSLLDGPGYVDPATGKVAFSYAHPIFWAPFSIVGDGR
jgi:CHAT domain-containing protein/tetratricopeptide (TPR) repeat protein